MQPLELLQRLNQLSTVIRIGDPIESAFKPELSFELPDSADISRHTLAYPYVLFGVTFNTRNSKGNDPLYIRVTSQQPVISFEANEFLTHPELLARFVFKRVMDMLQHELEESFLINGKYLYDPHPNRLSFIVKGQ